MAVSSGFLLKHTRVGLEFKGGYELNFAVSALQDGETLTSKQVLDTANILGERANKLGMSEPQVNILGTNEIRVILAGVNASDPSIVTLRDPAGLPARLTEKYSLSVGGVLGSEDFSNTLRAASIAIALIFLFLIVVYRGPGLIAVFAVAVTLWALLVAFNVLNAALSLASIVAYVLTIGIASDANILQFERIGDELRMNRSVEESVRGGCRHAFRTIVDSNATVLICAIVLMAVGIGPILGFALTTILSIVLSFVINVIFMQFLLGLLYGGQDNAIRFFGGRRLRKPRFAINYVRIGKWASLMTALFALVGLYAVATKPLNYDIEFKAGTALDIKIDQPITQPDATDMILSSGIAPATVAIGGRRTDMIAERLDDV